MSGQKTAFQFPPGMASRTETPIPAPASKPAPTVLTGAAAKADDLPVLSALNYTTLTLVSLAQIQQANAIVDGTIDVFGTTTATSIARFAVAAALDSLTPLQCEARLQELFSVEEQASPTVKLIRLSLVAMQQTRPGEANSDKAKQAETELEALRNSDDPVLAERARQVGTMLETALKAAA